MKILVTSRLSQKVIGILEQGHDIEVHGEDRPMERQKLLDSIGGKEGLLCTITDLIDHELMDRGPQLRMIANFGVGFDNIDVEAATARGIAVSNTPGVLTDATADLAFALLLASARRVVEGDRRTRAGKFRFFAPFHFLGSDVSGKTLGIIGLGRIGKAVARRARGFDMPVFYHNRRRIETAEEEALGATYRDLSTLLAGSDFVSLHVPLSEKTHHLIGREELEKMKPSAFLVNASRGPIVDEQALVEALVEGKIAGAGLDVYEKEPLLTPGLAELDNVVLLPHLGSATVETRTRMGMKAAENLLAGLKGERPPNCLNWHEIRRYAEKAQSTES
ncbi:MAG: D-glycerate dehydrogenase [Deltaproteobacteria bacterium]|nr:D-glycerate dehydrogenase [Deltaproteobacteria bacterium]